MSTKIHIPAEEVWSFFFENKERCTDEMVEIAANDDTKYAIYLTEDMGYPMLSVCHGDDEPEYEEGVVSKDDCTETAKRMFIRYLFPVTVTDGKTVFQKTAEKEDEPDEEDEDAIEQDMADEIYQRDDELTLALCDFLRVVFEEESDSDITELYGESVVCQILDEFLEHLADEHCLTNIRRPTFVSDAETGIEFYTEYPYDPDIFYEDQMEAIETKNENDGDTE